MQVWLRLLIVWCIALALPVQGFASVTMAHCGPSHEGMHAAQGASHHDHSAHQASAAHHHDAPAANAAAGPAKAQPAAFSDLAKYKCSACASCCAACALPSAMLRIPQPLSTPTVFAEDVVAVEAYACDGPDRPPRLFLA
jgi:hypothetical protein